MPDDTLFEVDRLFVPIAQFVLAEVDSFEDFALVYPGRHARQGLVLRKVEHFDAARERRLLESLVCQTVTR